LEYPKDLLLPFNKKTTDHHLHRLILNCFELFFWNNSSMSWSAVHLKI